MAAGLVSKYFGIIFTFIVGFASASQCWYPDQKTQSVDFPCNPGAGHSSCCGQGAFCTSNGLCLVNGVLSRGSCTDQTYQDPSCPSICPTYYPDRGVVILSCDTSTNTFVCGSRIDQCSSLNFTMTNTNGFIFNTSSFGPTTLVANEVVNLASQMTASINTIAPLASSSPSISASRTSDASPTSDNMPSRNVSCPPSATLSPDLRYTLADMVGVGLGVGAPLLLAFLGVLFVKWRQEKRLKSRQPPIAAPPPGNNQHSSDNKGGHFDYYPLGRPGHQPFVQLHGNHMSELGHEKQRHELPAMR